MCDQEVESCGCVDEECTGGRVQEAGADTAGVDNYLFSNVKSAHMTEIAKTDKIAEMSMDTQLD